MHGQALLHLPLPPLPLRSLGTAVSDYASTPQVPSVCNAWHAGCVHIAFSTDTPHNRVLFLHLFVSHGPLISGCALASMSRQWQAEGRACKA